MGTFAEEWWLKPDGGCAPSELAEALHGAILTDLLPLSTDRQITVSGIVSFRVLFYVLRAEYKFFLEIFFVFNIPGGMYIKDVGPSQEKF